MVMQVRFHNYDLQNAKIVSGQETLAIKNSAISKTHLFVCCCWIVAVLMMATQHLMNVKKM